jgi:hypothetical protein
MNHAAKRKLARKLLAKKDRKQLVTPHAKYSIGLFSSGVWEARKRAIEDRVKRTARQQHKRAIQQARLRKASLLGLSQTA